MYDVLITLGTEEEYRQLYIEQYCNKIITTHEGLEVRFPKHQFEHAFFTSSSRRISNKGIFSLERAKRIFWIKKALEDSSLPIFAGWDSKRKRYDGSRRVTIVIDDDYVIVLRLTAPGKCNFVTAFLIDDPGVKEKITSGPQFGKTDIKMTSY